MLLIHLMTTLTKLMGPGGAKAVVADSLLRKQQILVTKSSPQRAPNLSAFDRFLLGLWSLFLNPHRRLRTAVILQHLGSVGLVGRFAGNPIGEILVLLVAFLWSVIRSTLKTLSEVGKVWLMFQLRRFGFWSSMTLSMSRTALVKASNAR